MRLYSALEDVTNTTLEAVSGVLGKLNYLSGLRINGNSYTHWGLARVYGHSAAQEALTQAHKSVLAKVLRTPLPALVEDLRQCSKSAGVSPAIYLKNLIERQDILVPGNPASGASKHLSSVLDALLNLVKAPRASIHLTS